MPDTFLCPGIGIAGSLSSLEPAGCIGNAIACPAATSSDTPSEGCTWEDPDCWLCTLIARHKTRNAMSGNAARNRLMVLYLLAGNCLPCRRRAYGKVAED